MSLDQVDMRSIPGILILTSIIVEALKRVLGETKFGKLPIFVYILSVSLILTVISNLVLRQLVGNIWTLLWQVTIAATASSGFYEWLRQGNKSLKETSQP